MRFALMTEPQMGLTYADQLAIARRAEAAGFSGFFRSDHYESFPGRSDAPTTDAWAVLAGLARETERITLGTLVTPVTFRNPGNLAKVVVTVDEMSGGRIELGLGAGWHADEHRRHGFPFGEIGERADRLEETLAIVRGLWEEPDGWSYLGTHYAVEDSFFRPKPGVVGGRAGGRPRIITGGQGSPRGFRIAARWADEFNLSSAGPALVSEKLAALDEACLAIGRAPETLARSAMVGVLVGRDRAELAAREAALAQAFGDSSEDFGAWMAARRGRWIYGTPDEARAQLEAFAATGLGRLMFQDFIATDLDMIDLLGEIARG